MDTVLVRCLTRTFIGLITNSTITTSGLTWAVTSTAGTVTTQGLYFANGIAGQEQWKLWQFLSTVNKSGS